MTSEEMKATVRAFWESMNNGDLEAQLALCTDDVEFTVTGTTPVSGSNRGLEAVRGHFERFGALIESSPNMTVKELIADGNTVVCLSEGTMTAKTGIEYNNRYAFVFLFMDDKIASVTEYLDTALVETSLFGKSIS